MKANGVLRSRQRKFLSGMNDCTVTSDTGRGDFSLMRGILHMCEHTSERSHVSQGMDGSFIITITRAAERAGKMRQGLKA